MVISTLTILPLPNRRLETLELLRSVQGPAQAHPGCIACRVFEEDNPDPAILFLVGWESEHALHEHLRSDLYRRMLAAFELAKQPPEVCFHHVSSTQGMDLIQQLRNCGFVVPSDDTVVSASGPEDPASRPHMAVSKVSR